MLRSVETSLDISSLDCSDGDVCGAPSDDLAPVLRSLSMPLLESDSLRRSISTPRGAKLSKGVSLPNSRDDALSKAFGPARQARNKPGRLAVQDTEFHPDDMHKAPHLRRANVNPTRVSMVKELGSNGELQVKFRRQTSEKSCQLPPVSPSLLDQLDIEGLKKGTVGYKWNISMNGVLWVGESAPVDATTGQRVKQGHVTLVGGMSVPRSRISGLLRYDQGRNLFVIDNDSGRFSEHSDLTIQHLKNVAELFAQAGLSVSVEWKDMCKPKQKVRTSPTS